MHKVWLNGVAGTAFDLYNTPRCVHTIHTSIVILLLWRHSGRYGVSIYQPHDCLFNRLFGRWSKKKSKLCATGLCAGSPVTGEFLAQMASNAENVSTWWRQNVLPADLTHDLYSYKTGTG